MPDFEIEKSFSNQYKLIAGVDEVGRGALIGPVVAAAVIIQDYTNFIIEVDDSKKLSQTKREKICKELQNNGLFYGIGVVEAKEIDEINILQATYRAMKLAIQSLTIQPEFLLIDGNRFPSYHIPFQTIIKGDSKSNSIAAASIIAKVYRDNLMKEISKEILPEYGIISNKGYASKEHREAIKKYGYTIYHRQSFKLKELEEHRINLFN